MAGNYPENDIAKMNKKSRRKAGRKAKQSLTLQFIKAATALLNHYLE